MTKNIQNIVILASAIAFLIGGIFMLVNVFGGVEWAFIVGLAIVLATSIVVTIFFVLEKRGNKETTTNSTEENKASIEV
ncbi:MAG: hypothetical protein FWE16_02785 [Firmicutes bacterium]|nr:hypothetical protein [Bacillota bacterium]